MRVRGAGHAQRQVRRRADLQVHPGRRQALEQHRVLHRPHPVADAVGAQDADGLGHRVGPAQLARVRRGQQPAVARHGERLDKGARGIRPLVVGQPERDDTRLGVAHRKARRGGGTVRVSPIRRQHPADAHARRRAGVPPGVEQQFQHRLRRAEAAVVQRRVGGHLNPARAVGDLVLGQLTYEPDEVGGRAQQLLRGAVEAVEARPAHGLVGGAGSGQGRRESHARAQRELGKGARPHRPREVQVEVGLRQGVQI